MRQKVWQFFLVLFSTTHFLYLQFGLWSLLILGDTTSLCIDDTDELDLPAAFSFLFSQVLPSTSVVVVSS